MRDFKNMKKEELLELRNIYATSDAPLEVKEKAIQELEAFLYRKISGAENGDLTASDIYDIDIMEI